MASNKLLVGTLVGAVVAFLLGFLLYGVALMSFYEGNIGSAMGVVRDPPGLVAIAIGQIPFALFLTMAITRWGNSASVAGGAKVGAIFGLLVFLGFNLTMYGATNIQNMTATLVDPFVALVLWSVTGAAIGMVLGRGQTAAA
ncbi:MAG: hypothetical protein L0271_02855 [Gemmatimonadetes bacterium]|nr:hypothetical protein [Gemmatimonadota bacterium]